jgi:hypothetical protein
VLQVTPHFHSLVPDGVFVPREGGVRDGTTRLFFTGLERLRRVASLVPPLKLNLTRFHGVFAPGAKLRPFLVPKRERRRRAWRLKRWLAPAGFRSRPVTAPGTWMRILGPLDPILWDRGLVNQLFGFQYVWEVYKPEAQRRWGSCGGKRA